MTYKEYRDEGLPATAADDGINLLFNEFKFNTWEDISPAIGCRTFDVVRLYENGDCAYIDDEGLYQARFFWIHKNYPHPLANNALFCGTDEMGETVDFKTPLEVLKESIKPVSQSELYIYSRANPDDYRPFSSQRTSLALIRSIVRSSVTTQPSGLESANASTVNMMRWRHTAHAD